MTYTVAGEALAAHLAYSHHVTLEDALRKQYTSNQTEPPGPITQLHGVVAADRAPWKDVWDILTSARTCSYGPLGRSPDPSDINFHAWEVRARWNSPPPDVVLWIMECLSE